MKNKPSILKIKFVGKGINAPTFINDVKRRIDLPADQSKPFTHPDAKRILKLQSELYKKVLPKGRKVYRSAGSGKFVKPEFAKDNPLTTVSDTV